jgi:hypothetical protein
MDGKGAANSKGPIIFRQKRKENCQKIESKYNIGPIPFLFIHFIPLFFSAPIVKSCWTKTWAKHSSVMTKSFAVKTISGE